MAIASGSFAVSAGASIIQDTLMIAGQTSLSADGTGTSFACLGLASVDGASLYSSGGALLSLPGVQSFSNAGTGPTWQASGAGSVLELPGLTNLSSSSCCYVALKALPCL